MSERNDPGAERLRAILDQIIEAAPASEDELIRVLAKLGWDYLQRQWLMVMLVGALSGMGHQIGAAAYRQALTQIARLHKMARTKARESEQIGPWGPYPARSWTNR